MEEQKSITPVDIETFIRNPNYLGNSIGSYLYPYWIKKLKELYPTTELPVRRIVNFTGSLGTGKSTVAYICGLYENYLREMKGLRPRFYVISPYIDSKESEGKKSFVNWISENSPSLFDAPIHIIYTSIPEIYPLRHESDNITYDFENSGIVRKEVLNEVIKETLKNDNFSSIFIETLARDDKYLLEEVLRDYQNLVIINDPIWVAKDHCMSFSKREHFKVYINESKGEAYILEDPLQYTKLSEDDEGKIIEVPIDFYEEFKYHLELALQDLAGIPIELK